MGLLKMMNPQQQEELDQRTQSILIVDDEVNIRSAYCKLLSGRDRRVEEAGSGEAAIARLAKNDVDLVVLDLGLPDMTGLDVMNWMERNHIGTSVIVFSADDRIESAILALRLGAFEFIRKTCEPEELIQTVANALHRKRLEQAHVLMTARIEQSERLHRFLVDQSPDIIYTLDDRGTFVFMNGRIESLLGYRRDELIGLHYTAIIHDEDIEKARYAFMERRSGERSTANIEVRLKCRSDGYRHFDNRFVIAMLSSTGIYSLDEDNPVRRFMGTYGVARDITDRKKAEETINYQAFHDLLTQLPNRALFRDRLDTAINRARRNGSMGAVMFIDLDRFKLVNDTYGHAAGDELLKAFAARVRHCLRGSDTLGRQGGDEFTALLPDISSGEAAEAIARKILTALNEPFMLGSIEFRATASIGISVFPEDGNEADQLMRMADIAMYHVKLRGKNGCERYQGEMTVHHDKRMAFENDLRQALALNQFEVHYQPQVSVLQRKVVGVEALIRWRHPQHGLLNPGTFISIAEESGLISAISEWVLDQSCAQMARWRADGVEGLRLSVNVSPQEFDREDLVFRMTSVAQRHGQPLTELEAEITENILMEDAEKVICKVRSLRGKGIRVAIDDFGTRYSSLNYLRRFEVSSLKVDQSFVRDLGSEQGAEPIVLAIIGIARGFGLNVVAEGIETIQQMAVLRDLGCDEMQGFYFAKPLPPDELKTWLSNPYYVEGIIDGIVDA